ncbi:immunoglobulin-like domain-containing protein [Listeria grandensis]|uniref:immunoglobulin-like domain-containing protein n=1 Tax=Listeria grandensis TaxID=1494963 RepID=UPI00164E3B4B|nr:immunoglobulin-like domain-containing protein [Listeria grandensis]MBC6314411.1 hypothetical protein [Listeria grandensis]
MKKAMPKKVMIGVMSAGVLLFPFTSQYTPIADSVSAASQVPVTPQQTFTPYAVSELEYTSTNVNVIVSNFKLGTAASISPPFGNGLTMSNWVSGINGVTNFNYPLSIANANNSKLWTGNLELTIGKKLYAPIINELVNTNSTAITGYGIPGAQMTLKKGTQTLSEVLVNEWGQYKLTMPKQTLGTELSVVQSKNGETSMETKVAVLSPFTINTTIVYNTATDCVVLGTGSPGEVIVLRDTTTYASGHATVNAAGYYEMRISESRVSNTMGLWHGRPEHFTFSEGTGTPQVTGGVTPASFKVGSSYVTGTFTGDVTKGLLVINGTPQSIRGDFTSTGFRYYIEGSQIKAGDRVEFVGLNAQNKVTTLGKKVTVSP